MQFKFGQIVKRIDGTERFVVLGIEKSGRVQVARMDHKTSFKADELERVGNV